MLPPLPVYVCVFVVVSLIRLMHVNGINMKYLLDVCMNIEGKGKKSVLLEAPNE